MKEQNREITEIERMAIDMDKLFYEAEIKQTLPKKHPSIVKAESLYNAGYRKQKEGEWIGSGQTDEYICSLCGGIAPVDCEKEDFYKSNFCPNCGAKMKGGAE